MTAKAKKCRVLRGRLREAKSGAEAEIENVRSENLRLTALVEELQVPVAEAESAMAKLKQKLEAAKQQLKSAEISAADSVAVLKSDHERIVGSLEQGKLAQQQELNDHINRLKEQLAAASETIWAQEGTIVKLQRMVRHTHELVTEKAEQVAEVEKAKAAELCQQAAQNKAEREPLVEDYEAALSELKQQNDVHRCDFENVSQELLEAEKQLRRQQTMIIGLKRSQNELQKRLEGLIEESERAVQVGEAMMKNVSVTAELKAVQKIQEATAKFENEK
jgi:chromosome segregation ATPase